MAIASQNLNDEAAPPASSSARQDISATCWSPTLNADVCRGLNNEDLAPVKERNWGAFSIFNVWTSDVHSLWGYYLAASLFLLCGSFVNFLLAIGLGSLVIFAIMNMLGYAGVKTGVPYPVLARASFGVWGPIFRP